MSRIIKFRAWDEQKKVMHNDFQFIKSGDSGNDWIVFESDKQPRKTDGNKIILDDPYFAKQLKIMAFTGLLDKNGKEIYEADIVHAKVNKTKNKALDSDAGIIAIVWENGGFFLEDYSNNLGWQCENLDIEVIGNIYENPSLIKPK